MAKGPSYRHKKSRNLAIVTLRDSETGRRRDFLLGRYNSPERREAYHQFVAQWERSGWRLPDADDVPKGRGVTISEIVLPYWQHTQRIQKPSGFLTSIKSPLRLLRQTYGS